MKRFIYTFVLILFFPVILWGGTTTVKLGLNTQGSYICDYLNNTEDNYGHANDSDANMGARTYFYVGTNNSNQDMAAYLRFEDIADSIGADKTVIEATLYIYCEGELNSTDRNIILRAIMGDTSRVWGEGDNDGTTADAVHDVRRAARQIGQQATEGAHVVLPLPLGGEQPPPVCLVIAVGL